MSLFDYITERAELIEEIRKAKYDAIFNLEIPKAQLKDKKMGIPYRDALRFWYSWAREAQIWPKGIPLESKIPLETKDITAVIGAYVTSPDFKPESTQMWEEYIKDPSHIEDFMGFIRVTRAGKKYRGDKAPVELAKSAEDRKAITPEEILKRKEMRKQPVEKSKIDFYGFKLLIVAKLRDPHLREYLLNFALDNEIDSEQEAEAVVERAVEQATDALKNAQTMDDILNNLEQMQVSGSPTAADLAEAVFNFIKKKISVEDVPAETEDNYDNEEDIFDTEEDSEEDLDDDPEGRSPYGYHRPDRIEKDKTSKSHSHRVKSKSEHESDIASVDFKSPIKRPKPKFVLSRERFKARNIHQQVQKERDGDPR